MKFGEAKSFRCFEVGPRWVNSALTRPNPPPAGVESVLLSVNSMNSMNQAESTKKYKEIRYDPKRGSRYLHGNNVDFQSKSDRDPFPKLTADRIEMSKALQLGGGTRGHRRARGTLVWAFGWPAPGARG